MASCVEWKLRDGLVMNSATRTDDGSESITRLRQWHPVGALAGQIAQPRRKPGPETSAEPGKKPARK